MTKNSLIFFVDFPVGGATWKIQCSVTNFGDEGILLPEEDIDVVRIMNAQHNGVRLDESSWKALLEDNNLLGSFCEKMLSTLSFVQWTLSGPMAEA